MASAPRDGTARALVDQAGELMYPGEDAPLVLRAGGQPITDDEALGVARRWVREANERLGHSEPLPSQLPLPSTPGVTPLASFRISRREVMLSRAKAEMEGRSLTEVVREILAAYNRSEPGATVQYTYRGTPGPVPEPAEAPAGMLPGEAAPLPLRLGGQPVRDDEALGVARRWVREANERLGRSDEIPAELPLPSEAGATPLATFRIPKRDVMISRAKAEMEARSVTEVVREGLAAYARSEPGAKVQYTYRGPRAAGSDRSKK